MNRIDPTPRHRPLRLTTRIIHPLLLRLFLPLIRRHNAQRRQSHNAQRRQSHNPWQRQPHNAQRRQPHNPWQRQPHNPWQRQPLTQRLYAKAKTHTLGQLRYHHHPRYRQRLPRRRRTDFSASSTCPTSPTITFPSSHSQQRYSQPDQPTSPHPSPHPVQNSPKLSAPQKWSRETRTGTTWPYTSAHSSTNSKNWEQDPLQTTPGASPRFTRSLQPTQYSSEPATLWKLTKVTNSSSPVLSALSSVASEQRGSKPLHAPSLPKSVVSTYK